MTKKLKKGFTLIELLIVIAIIGVLSTLIVVGYNSAKVKSRDARRISDVNTIASAVKLLGENNGRNYFLSGTVGNGNQSWGWFNCNNTRCAEVTYPGNRSIGQFLVDEKYLSFEPVDPSGKFTTTAYMYYHFKSTSTPCDDTSVDQKQIRPNLTSPDYFYVYAKLESPTAETARVIDPAPDGYCSLNTHAKTFYKMNYAVGGE